MNHQDNNSQRFTSYRAVIPFYILYDLDLNANHLRLYGQIEQMESNPDPSVSASFSYAWLAKQLGINRRNAMKIATLLIKKEYIVHKEVSPGKYIWNTKKKSVASQNDNEWCRTETPPQCLPETPPGVAQRHPKIPKDKIQKDNNKTPISPTKKKDNSLPFERIKENNVHDITEELITEWKGIRKKPLTERVWNKTNQVMNELTLKGMNGKEAFELMLEKQWQGMEVRYFTDYFSHRNETNNKNTKGKSGDSLSRVLNKYLSSGAMYDQYGNTVELLHG